jgi:hypothetical protein
MSLAKSEDPETSGPVLCDLSKGKALFRGVARELLRGGWTRLAPEATAFGVRCCISRHKVSDGWESNAASGVVMQEAIDERVNSRSPESSSLASACKSIASGMAEMKEALVDSRVEFLGTSVISARDDSTGVDREFGTKVGQSR